MKILHFSFQRNNTDTTCVRLPRGYKRTYDILEDLLSLLEATRCADVRNRTARELDDHSVQLLRVLKSQITEYLAHTSNHFECDCIAPVPTTSSYELDTPGIMSYLLDMTDDLLEVKNSDRVSILEKMKAEVFNILVCCTYVYDCLCEKCIAAYAHPRKH